MGEIYFFILELLKTTFFSFHRAGMGTAPACDVAQARQWMKGFHASCAPWGRWEVPAEGSEPRESALRGVILPAGTLRMSPGITSLWYVALLFQIFDNEAKDLEREVCFIDIACDEIPERYYKESEVSHRWDDMWKRFIRSTNIIKSFLTWETSLYLSLCWFTLVSHLAGFLIAVSKWSPDASGPITGPGCRSISV